MIFFNIFQFLLLVWSVYYTIVLFFANKRLRREMDASREEFTQREALARASSNIITEINNGCYDHYCTSFKTPIPRNRLVEHIENAIISKIKSGLNDTSHSYTAHWETNQFIKINLYCERVGITRYAFVGISKVENFHEKESCTEDQTPA